MGNYLLCVILFRIVWPLIVLCATVFRPTLFSAIYLLLLLCSASMPIPTEKSMSGSTGIYLKIVILIATLTSVTVIVFQSVLIIEYQYALPLEPCSFLEKLLRHVALIRLDHLEPVPLVNFVLPEVIMFVFSIAFYLIFSKITKETDAILQQEEGDLLHKVPNVKKKYSFFQSIGKYAAIEILGLVAVFEPSIQGGFYFLIYLSASTWWACSKQLGAGFSIVLRICMASMFCHIFLLYSYQMQWVQEIMPSNSSLTRYFAVKQLLAVDCNKPRQFIILPETWQSYSNIFLLIFTYFFLAVVIKYCKPPKIQVSKRREDETPCETTPLMRSTRQLKNPSVYQDSTGSVMVSGTPDEISLRNIQDVSDEEFEKPSIIERVIFVFESIILFVIRTSYIATNIIMMTWSITYHSWLTFVLLLWANIIWMIPNQRQNMLRSSPFLVVYACFLLITSYIYSMNLTEAELPTVIFDIDVAQLGFSKGNDPVTLIIKCLFTSMFWVTLRQYMKERRDARNKSVLADMVAPLEVSVSAVAGIENVSRLFRDGQRYKKKIYPKKNSTTDSSAYLSPYQQTSVDEGVGSSATGPSDSKREEKESDWLRRLGVVLHSFLTTFWIWVVAITLFSVAITGDRMTSFRILYMTLFLAFILSFQLSFRVWRKIMFGFWLTVIIYSMIVLIMVYTYQFDNFKEYWKTYLHVDYEQQQDIGLEKFDTKLLFVRLVTPTFFVIITVVQLHYFHKDFMIMSKPAQSNVTYDATKSEANSSAQGGFNQMKEEDDDEEETEEDEMNASVMVVQKKLYKFKQFLIRMYNLVLLFFEIHMPKLVLLAAVIISVLDPCAIYFVIVILAVLGTTIGKRMVDATIYIISIMSSVLVLGRMVYQIKYIDHKQWDVSCNVSNVTNVTGNYNQAEWLGLRKVDAENDLTQLVKWNIVYIAVVMLWCIIKVRQLNYRMSRGDYVARPFFMFPNIRVQDANRNLSTYFKYLANFFYYRLGVEMSLIGLVATIGIRMDIYAILYSIWLCVLFLMDRKNMARTWNVFLIFIAIVIPIQYFLVIGFPPKLCLIDFTFTDNPYLLKLQSWAFFTYFQFDKTAGRKIICDYVLLLLVARQSLVFRIEKRHGANYVGGSNESIVKHAEEKDFNNPMPDFITFSLSYLDVFKKAAFLPFIWITFAVVFLAGANRVNLFSIGYLLGAFYFLWQGSDIYLIPISSILQKWNYMLVYNVSVITIKVFFQLFGCVFIDYLELNACALVEILGIYCLNTKSIFTMGQGSCDIQREHVDASWDVACFAFLICQKRMFNSYNFFHMINENKASTILASRGAELIEELRGKRMQDQEDEERAIIEKIKSKMERIKANQQKILGPNYQQTNSHYIAGPPLARSTSVSSCTSGTSSRTSQRTTTPTGYHTPIEDDAQRPVETPAASSVVQPNAPSPFSALMTGSLEAYLDPQRMSFSSPPNSELNPRPASPDESFPVFSPPPYDEAPPYAEAVSEQTTVIQRQHSLGPSWMAGSLVTPRQSVISYSSRSPMSHHTYTIYPKTSRPLYRRTEPKSYKAAIRSGDYYMFDDLETEELDFEDAVGTEAEEEEEEARRGRDVTQTLGELLNSTIKTDIGTVVRSRIHRRRVSLPQEGAGGVQPTESQISAPFSAPPTVRIKEEVEVYEPQPSTSRSVPPSVESKKDKVKQRSHRYQKFLDYVLFVFTFIESAMLSAVNHMNKYSKDYRYVLRVLSKEKQILKETSDYQKGVRTGPNSVWQPTGTYRTLINEEDHVSVEPTPSIATYSPSDSYRLGLSNVSNRSNFSNLSECSNVSNPSGGISNRSGFSERADFNNRSIRSILSNRSKTSGRTMEVKSDKQQDSEQDTVTKVACQSSESAGQDRRKASVFTVVPEIRILAPSMERGLDSPDGSVLIRQNAIEEYYYGELSSYEQPMYLRLLLAFWYIVLTYSDLICYFVIFLNQIRNATLMSLPLPLMVFFWGTLTIPRPSKSFWITIIAYTQVIVIIKCVCQFSQLPWNAPNYIRSFDIASFIGIERSSNYAIWDLVVLLVVHLHRYLLMCLGLWKSGPETVAILADGDYRVENGELQYSKSNVNRIEYARITHGISKVHLRIKIYNTHVINAKFYYFQRKRKYRLQNEYVTTSSLRQTKGGMMVIRPPRERSDEGEDVPSGSQDQEDTRSRTTSISGDDDEDKIHLHSAVVDTKELFPSSFGIILEKYAEHLKIFFTQLVDPTSRLADDVYSYMFLCDFFNFFVILIGYSSFGTPQLGDGGVSSYLEENKVPIFFLLMLIVQFLMIIADRAIFLRKNIFAKIIFQFIQILMLHIWLFIVFPVTAERRMNAVIPPQIYYMVKCFYLLLSAYQIRSGYPTRILGNFLCKGYSYINMFLFKGFMLIPFLFELRTVMDWMWTDTSMTVFDWIKMEDIFAHIYQLKCTRYIESEYPQPRGERKKPIIKYLMGGGLLIIIITTIWFPLVFFSLSGAVGKPNIPYDISFNLRLGPYEPLYKMSAQSNSIYQFNENEFTLLQNLYTKEKSASIFLSNYDYGDVAAVKLSSDSATIWNISPPDRDRMILEVKSNNTVYIRFQYEISHKTNSKEEQPVLRDDVVLELHAFIDGVPNPIRSSILMMLQGIDTEPVLLQYVMPKFIKVTNRGTAQAVENLMNVDKKVMNPLQKKYRSVLLKLAHDSELKEFWWEVNEDCSDMNYDLYLSKLPYSDCGSLVIYTFNDKIFPSTLSFLSGGGIIGLYTTLVFVASRVLRGFFSEICFKIMFDDMPYVDRVLQLCFDVYLVREAGEFALEEDLFAKLVFLYRSPETLIKWTRPKEEVDDEDNPEGDENQ